MTGRLVLITGGTRGLGKAVAECFLADGDDVILTYASDSVRADEVSAELLEKHSERMVLTLRADASSMDSITVIEKELDSIGRSLDVLVLNAGLTDRSPFNELDVKAWGQVFDANINVPVFTIQRLLDRFGRGASVIFTGSLMGIEPHSMSLAYGVTKAAVHALTENLVKFLAPHGIRVNAVAPGFVDTEWQLTKPQEIRDSINSKISMERFALPEEIAEAYLMLANSPYITGETIRIDGGYSYR